jgi:hypothetical protein
MILHSLSKYFITLNQLFFLVALIMSDLRIVRMEEVEGRRKVTYMIFLRRFNLLDCDIDTQVTPFASAKSM